MGFGTLVVPFEGSDASTNSVRCVGSDAPTRRPKWAVFDLALRPAGLTEDFRAFVDRSGALATLRVLLDPLRALVSPAAMSDSLAIPEPFAAFSTLAPTNVGSKLASFELVAAIVFFDLNCLVPRCFVAKK